MRSVIGQGCYAAMKCERRPCVVMRAAGLGRMKTAEGATLGELSDGCGMQW